MLKNHANWVSLIQKELADWKEGKAFSTLIQNKASNTMRKKSYLSPPLSTKKLSQVLKIDPNKKIVWTEPSVTMEQLVDKTLEYGLIPSIVPEFKGITVGGAINGAALESSSHQFGQFNDQSLSYEILTGCGSVIYADKNEHSDLFYGISGSYGTLGILLAAKLKLIQASPSVLLKYYRFLSFQEAISFLIEKHLSKNPPIYMEAIVYRPDLTIVILGNLFSGSCQKSLSLKKPWSEWFYQHALTADGSEEVIPIKDYLFRHDRGAFWMGGYAKNFGLSYLTHKLETKLKFLQTSLSRKFLPNFAPSIYPGKLFRTLFSPLMDSQKLYKSLHSGSETWFEEHFVIQDFYFSKENAVEFISYVLNKYQITPIWVCPILSTTEPQIFSPHFRKQKKLLFNIGVYGYPIGFKGSTAVRDLEEKTYYAKERKMFYCLSYLDKKKFWENYPEKYYKAMRQKYKFDLISPEITEKILEQNSE